MAINATDFLAALEEIEVAKGISRETILQALQEALIKGFRKQLGGDDANVKVIIDAEKGTIDMYQIKDVVKDVEDDFLQITSKDANALDPTKKYKVGDEFHIPASVDDLRKGIALSIKSILKQKFAEAEKAILYEAFKDKIGTMITGKVEKVDERGCSVNIGRTSAYLPRKEMIGDERFENGSPIKLFVKDVESGPKGAHIVITRADEGFLRSLFFEEIHEIYDGTIEIKGIAREAGERSKVAVYSKDPNVDPAGACIGPNGSRIQKIVGQLGKDQIKEKIDIISYSDSKGLFIMESLKPAHVVGIILEDNNAATAIVKDDSLSLAIGRKGVNARLAVKLTGCKIDIKTESDALNEGLEYQSFEQLQAEEIKARTRLAEEQRMAAILAKVEEESVLPGLPNDYVAPQDRIYEEEEPNDFDEALSEKVEEEDIKEIIETPVQEVEQVKVETPVQEEKKETPQVEVKKTEVKTTTSIEELEKNLASEVNKNKPSKSKKSYTSKKHKDEDEDDKTTAIDTSSSGTRMSIYTEEELRAIEEEESLQNDEYDDDDVDYDEYDSYYDDDEK